MRIHARYIYIPAGKGSANGYYSAYRNISRFVALFFTVIFFSLSVQAATKTWTGAVSTDWNTAGNWSVSGVPGSGDDVIIPTSPSGGRMPVLSSGTLAVKSVTIQAGATLTQNGGVLTISGAAITIGGNFNISAGTWQCANSITVSSGGVISVSGSGTVHMANAIATTPTDHMVIDAGGVINQTGGNINTKDLTTTAGTPAGTFNQSGGTLKMYHDFKNNGVFNSTGGTIQFSGSGGGGTFPLAVQSSNTQFYDVIIDAGVDAGFGANEPTSVNIAGNWTNNSSTTDLITKAATIIFNGSGNQTIGGSQPTVFRNLTVNKPAGTITLLSNASLTSGDLTISGIFDLGTYTLNRNSAGGILTLSSGSSLKLAGNSGGQAGSNFPLNFSSISLNSTSTVEYYGSNVVTQTIFAGATYGHLTLTNGSGSGISSKVSTANLTVNGSLTVNSNSVFTPGATFTVGGTGTLTGAGTVEVTRTVATADFNSQYTISGKTLTSLTVNYNAAAAQTINALNYFNLGINGNRSTNSVTLANSGTIGISGTFNPAATFTSGGYILTNSTVDFNGSGPQNIPAFNFNNLTLSGGAKTAAGVISVNGNFTLNSTILSTTSSNLLVINDNGTASGASLTAFVSGPVKKIGNDAFTFPVGKAGAGYMPISISAPSSATDAFTAEYQRGSASALGLVTAPGLFRVSNCDYWDLNRVTGSSAVDVTLSWNGYSNCNIAAYINNLASLTVAHFNGTNWDTHGVNSFTGNASSGTITRNNVSVFSPFSLGSTDDYSNPLQVQFTSVKAYRKETGVNIEWTNLNESGIQGYEIERSNNGVDFKKIGHLDASYNNNMSANYGWYDSEKLVQINYYRIKAIDNSGQYVYSNIVKISAKSGGDFTLYPIPLNTPTLSIYSPDLEKGNYRIRIFNMIGAEMFNRVYLHNGGIFNQSLTILPTLKPGVYHVQVLSNNYPFFQKQIVVQ